MSEENKSNTVVATSTYLKENGIDEVSVEYPFPETVEELVTKYGEKIVHSNAVSSFIITLQGNLRRWAKTLHEAGELSAEALQAKADAWIPGVVNRSKMSKVDKAKKALENMSAAELQEYLALVQQRAAEVAGADSEEAA